MERELIVKKYNNDKILGFYKVNGKFERIFDLDESVLGNIYCGVVKDIAKNLDSAFVEFAGSLKGFYQFETEEDYKLKPNDKVLVQVAAEKMKNKDYKLTSNISLKSDCLILTSGNDSINLSRKIVDEDERDRIKTVLESLNSEYGFIVRTIATECSDKEIKKQAKELIKTMDDVNRKFKYAKPKSKLQAFSNPLSVVKELRHEELEIITDDKQLYDYMVSFHLNPKFYDNPDVSIDNAYRIGKCIEEIKSEKVWLKSGAYIVIESTESLTSIDVNSGKCDLHKDREAMIRAINHEASDEILTQLKLRNISGIIVVDFINMRAKEDYKKLHQHMDDISKFDYVQCTVVDYTKLGLLEITRRKLTKPTIELLEEQ